MRRSECVNALQNAAQIVVGDFCFYAGMPNADLVKQAGAPILVHRDIANLLDEEYTLKLIASSYTVYNGGIEIEVDTKPEFRRKGLAAACSARLILECLQRELYPSWDAHDLRSVALAEKLGYHADDPYTVYIKR
jgi:GNAT superfamily N-acetyltransferase